MYAVAEQVSDGWWIAKASCGCCGTVVQAEDVSEHFAIVKATQKLRKETSGDCAVEAD